MAAFRTFDTDQSGLISIRELREAFDKMGTKKEETLWLDIMAEVDKNGDNMISFEEFADSMQDVIRRRVSQRNR
jgi:Ca2+-binding EF-hand superfamily protein